MKAIIIKGTLSSILLVDIPYSRNYWRSLNLAVWSRAAEIKILADFNLAVRAEPPNLTHRQIFRLYGISTSKIEDKVMYKINVEPNSTDMLRKESH